MWKNDPEVCGVKRKHKSFMCYAAPYGGDPDTANRNGWDWMVTLSDSDGIEHVIAQGHSWSQNTAQESAERWLADNTTL